MARAILLFLAKRLGLARVSKFETRPATTGNEVFASFSRNSNTWTLNGRAYKM
jgi:hypothetical protein